MFYHYFVDNMGCFPSKTKRVQETTAFVHKVEDLKILPSTFVQINQRSFLKVYKLGRSLGSGAFGEVRFCTHKKTNARRAVKIFKKDIFTNEIDKEKLVKEIEILRILDHPSIVRAYEFFEDPADFYIVMEHCRGGELFEEIMKKKQFKEEETAIIMKQIFSCLAYIHSKHIIHRDLKPENILLDDHSDFLNIKLIDFGTATKFNPGSKVKGALGTAYYIAPEVLAGSYSEKCDMWSAGVIAFVLLAGYPPFEGANDEEIIQKVKVGNYSFKGSTWNKVTEFAKDLIRHLLVPEKDRLSAIEALNHPWIRDVNINNVDNGKLQSTLQHLTNYNSTNKLRDAVNTYIVTQLTSNNDTKEAREMFRALDTNGDGKLSREELIRGYVKPGGITEEDVDRIMREVDTDLNGYIDYTEFLKAAVDQQKYASQSNLKIAFEMFDRDGSGKISALELKEMLQGENATNNELWNELIKTVDQNGDGEIDLKEFEDIILNKF
ncbi:unnamed protein product [Blepharisma stoltei]|uniref:non-specific serine/threonine protein kinase n=1 Tax=Blepharisma stoltei TaxID=1481888 RepID=A0AAU9JII2_9CILI|nr:unnamed protein product [Blepharisma stoltei]